MNKIFVVDICSGKNHTISIFRGDMLRNWKLIPFKTPSITFCRLLLDTPCWRCLLKLLDRVFPQRKRNSVYFCFNFSKGLSVCNQKYILFIKKNNDFFFYKLSMQIAAWINTITRKIKMSRLQAYPPIKDFFITFRRESTKYFMSMVQTFCSVEVNYMTDIN